MKLKIFVSEDKEVVDTIREQLKKNGGYCPCYLFRDDDHKCMCKDFREQTTEGECHCGLYYKKLVEEN